MAYIKGIEIEDAQCIFKNFSGKASKYNKSGDRNFCVILPNDEVDRLIKEGWNVKFLRPREDGDEPVPYLKNVRVSFHKDRPDMDPVIYTYAGKVRTRLTEKTVGMLDFSGIDHVDLYISPYKYQDDNGKTKVSAYLREMHVTLIQRFGGKYDDVYEDENEDY